MAKYITKFEFTNQDMVKAIRRGSREAEIENSNGWTSKHKVHKSKKAYTRKNKHKIY